METAREGWREREREIVERVTDEQKAKLKGLHQHTNTENGNRQWLHFSVGKLHFHHHGI